LTEIPEHLLRRSRERRAALGLGGDDAGSSGEAAPGASAAPAKPAAGAAPARTAGAGAVASKAEQPVAVVAPPPPVRVPPPQGPHKLKVPLWALPVLVALPLWAFFYPGAFSNHQKSAVVDPLVLGADTYHSAGCSTCHGSNGEGGVGPALHGGASALTFPAIADQIQWVKTGSSSFAGKPYGDPNRAGGQRGPAKGIMPAFGSSLSPEQIAAVVTYERTKL
jgi:mono/diheme cytochrome c family protein